MMKIEPLLFLLIIEVALLTSIAAAFLLKRYKEQEKVLMNISNKRNELVKAYSNELRGISGQLERFKKKPGKAEEKNITIDYHSSRINFLSSIIESLKKSEQKEGFYCETIFKRFEGLNHQLFSQIKSLFEEKKQLKTLTVRQKQQIFKLSTYRNMLSDLEERFEQVKNTNEKLKNSITQLIPEAERSKDLEEMLEEFEKNRRDLDNCLGTLENQNELMSELIEKNQEEIEGLAGLADDYNKLLLEKNELEKKLSNTGSELKQVTSAHELLQNNFNMLEAEYNRLYDEAKHDEE